MSRQEAIKQYALALRAGQKCYRSCIHQGRYPYPQVLDELLDESMTSGTVELGIVDIPMERIVGTRNAGRKNAFAADFMPLLEPESEFGMKWIALCEAHLSEAGITDPIRCFEYLGRFYVQEGNKRVSVMKSFGAATIPGYVTRILPVWSEEADVQAYSEFLEFYQECHLYWIRFSRPGLYAKLRAALGKDEGTVWSEDERRMFTASFCRFREALPRQERQATAEEISAALLIWLQVYSLEQLRQMSDEELSDSISGIWLDVQALERQNPIRVSTAPEEAPRGLLGKLFLPTFLHVAFLYEYSPQKSPWIMAHEEGRRYLERELGDHLSTRVYEIPPDQAPEQVMETAIADGAQVLVACTASLIGACRKIAARYKDLYILNCSVSMPYPGVRTYYSRIYEGKFISGAVAGAMAQGDTIGYIASNPIFGVPAGINAFALGARLTNPRARVLLKWSCVSEDPLEEIRSAGVELVSNRDIPLPSVAFGSWGLCRIEEDGGLEPLVSPFWNWGIFYVKLLGSILQGSWIPDRDTQAVNYWWGIRTGAVGIKMAPTLPEGVKTLANILKRGLRDESVFPFSRRIVSQDGTLRNDGTHWFTPEEVLKMDWLCDCVEGSIPRFEELLPMAQNIVRLQGVYRDELPPEKDEVLL